SSLLRISEPGPRSDVRREPVASMLRLCRTSLTRPRTNLHPHAERHIAKNWYYLLRGSVKGLSQSIQCLRVRSLSSISLHLFDFFAQASDLARMGSTSHALPQLVRPESGRTTPTRVQLALAARFLPFAFPASAIPARTSARAAHSATVRVSALPRPQMSLRTTSASTPKISDSACASRASARGSIVPSSGLSASVSRSRRWPRE